MSETVNEKVEAAKALLYKKKNSFVSNPEKTDAIFAYAEGYKHFLDAAKTEREAVAYAIEAAEKAGFTEFDFGQKLSIGDKKYYNNRGKAIFLFTVGHDDIETAGVRILAAHIDSPRLDLKQVPLFEEGGMAFLKTHYYGGIKKYQWTALPLAWHGVILTKDGRSHTVAIGERPEDPIFYINDLLPHLGHEQAQKPLGSAIAGETLNLLVGGLPLGDCDDAVKLSVLSYLNEAYGIDERDLETAELCAVPVFPARDIGFDRALIGSYGHDDRVCAYPALSAILESADTSHTLMTALVDKEEIGSEGVSGMQSEIFSDLLNEIARAKGASPAAVRAHSVCLSADVNAAYDPNFAEVYEKRNSAMISCGTAMSKYTGARGKSGTSDASAELCARIARVFREAGAAYQTAELGKIDIGGGGTVAKYTANMNIDTIDIGVPVISMHAPYEVVSKADLYSTYEAFCAFCRAETV